eukprot:COSAG06_NODE_43_length_29826_cov_32.009621_12_plen_252_part_00
MKRKAAASALGASRNPRRFEHLAANRVKSAVQRKGVWKEDEFVADGQKEYGEPSGDVTPWKVRYWDDEGCLVDEGANHEGHLRTTFRLLDANTMQMRVSLVVDPPTGNAMVRRYSRDGETLAGEMPRLPDDEDATEGGSDAAAQAAPTPTPPKAEEPEKPVESAAAAERLPAKAEAAAPPADTNSVAAAASSAKTDAAPRPPPQHQQQGRGGRGRLLARVGIPSAVVVALLAAYWARLGARVLRYIISRGR